jgi:hypothetical protein
MLTSILGSQGLPFRFTVVSPVSLFEECIIVLSGYIYHGVRAQWKVL